VTCTANGHSPACRQARPLCRWRRAKHPAYRPCRCSVVHYPHRAGWCAKFGGMPLAIVKSRSYQNQTDEA
jgi:hypothetical protein